MEFRFFAALRMTITMKIFRKTGVSTLINILGFGVAFAAASILLVQALWDVRYDDNFKGCEKVYRIEHNMFDRGKFASMLSRPLIELIRYKSPEIEAMGTTGLTGNSGANQVYPVGKEEVKITTSITPIDTSMFRIYPFEFIEGSAKDFVSKNETIISESTARKLFDKDSAVGKMVVSDYGGTLTVVGVYRDLPKNGTFCSDMFTNLDDEDMENMGEWSYSCFVKVKDAATVPDPSFIRNAVIEQYSDGASEEDLEKFIYQFRLIQLHEAHYERDARSGVTCANRSVVYTLIAIALLLIVITIINFINFAFAEIPFRIKAINTRKVLGEARRSLVFRQLMHACAVALAGFALSLLLFYLFSGCPLASFVSGSLDLLDNIPLLSVMLGIAILTAIAAGLAPAFYSTSQPAALVLKGSFGTSVGGRALRNVLISVQFVLSFLFVIVAFYVRLQTDYMINKDLGFNMERVLQVQATSEMGKKKDVVENNMLNNPDILDVTFADCELVSNFRMCWSRGNTDAGELITFDVYPVDVDFLPFFGFKIIEGRDFSKADDLSEGGAFIGNKAMMDAYPGCFEVGDPFRGHASVPGEFAGVVEDFHFKSLHHAVGPFVFMVWGQQYWRYFRVMYVKVAPGADIKAVTSYIMENIPISDPSKIKVTPMKEYIGTSYREEKALGRLITIASLVALLIAIIGIIGLVFFETQFLRKEIAVRRVNGASVNGILRMINKKYIIVAVVSFIVAAPIAYYAIMAWRMSFAYRAPVPVWIFALSFVLVTFVTIVVVTVQSWRASNANPVESLNKE